MASSREPQDFAASVYHVESSDPESVLVDRSAMSHQDLEQINRLMSALGALRKAEERLSDASTTYMKLNKTDMRALHYLIVSQNRDELATPGAIASYLGISSASTTKLLDRLARGGHITRQPHPSDRRALVIRITPQTHQSAVDTVGRQQSKRFNSAARLTPQEREIVIGFIEDMTREIDIGDADWARGKDSD